MQIKTKSITTYEIIADEGKKLTDGEGYYSRVFLSNLDKVENYTEIAEDEIKEFNEEIPAEETDVNMEETNIG